MCFLTGIKSILILHYYYRTLLSSSIDKDRLYSVMEQKCAIVSIFNSYRIIRSFGKDNIVFCHKAVDKLHYTNDRKRS